MLKYCITIFGIVGSTVDKNGWNGLINWFNICILSVNYNFKVVCHKKIVGNRPNRKLGFEAPANHFLRRFSILYTLSVIYHNIHIMWRVCVKFYFLLFTPSAWKMAGRKLLSGLGSHSILLLGNEPLPLKSRESGLRNYTWRETPNTFFRSTHTGLITLIWVNHWRLLLHVVERTNIYPLTFTKRFFLWIRKQKTRLAAKAAAAKLQSCGLWHLTKMVFKLYTAKRFSLCAWVSKKKPPLMMIMSFFFVHFGRDVLIFPWLL